MNNCHCKLLILFTLFNQYIAAQTQALESSHQSSHSIALVISHTQINEGVNENGIKQWLSLPSWGINYNYNISEDWAIGLHTDIIVEDFKVESLSKSRETIERSYPIASAIVASFKPGKHFTFMLGSGAEYTKEDTFFLIRVGTEYSLHINHDLELIANLINDLKFNGYNSWGIGLGLAYKL